MGRKAMSVWRYLASVISSCEGSEYQLELENIANLLIRYEGDVERFWLALESIATVLGQRV